MSIDINWETITSGPDGDALAERIRSFIDDKFQQVSLPRFIRSVNVHSFDFGKTGPDLVIKDICNPLPDFYEDGSDGEEVEDEQEHENENENDEVAESRSAKKQETDSVDRQPDPSTHPLSDSRSRRPIPNGINTRPSALRPPFGFSDYPGSPFLARTGTPGIPGGTSNLSYFHLPLSNLSGSQTPLAAVAGGTPFGGWNDNNARRSEGPFPRTPVQTMSPLPQGEEVGSPSRPSTANSAPSPTSQKPSSGGSVGADAIHNDARQRSDDSGEGDDNEDQYPPPPKREKRVEDLQVITRVRYAGDIRLSLTAEILLDYPMPSFVALPLKLNITGLTFDGVAVLAYIRRRAHFCFLSPEDGQAYSGTGDNDESRAGQATTTVPPSRGLLQEIKVESEIGRKESGKQVLKNVGKVEKFVLEQVRRIFEDEFVYPSFWTFLV